MGSNVIRLLIEDDGATLVEYGLLVLLIAVVSVSVLKALGPKIAGLYAPIAPAI